MDVDSTTTDPIVTQSVTQRLIDQQLEEFRGAVVRHVTAKFQHQEQLLEQAKRELEEAKYELALYKKAAECERHNLEARFEQEKQALNDEVHQLRERGGRGHEEKFGHEERTLNGGILQPKAIVTREKRVMDQRNPPPAPGTRQYATVHKGTQCT